MEHHVIAAIDAPPRKIPKERIDLFLHEALPEDPKDPVAALRAIRPILGGGLFNKLFY